MKRTRLFSLAAWILLLSVLMMAMAGCGNTTAAPADNDKVAQLEAENAQLKEQIATLTARLDQLESSGFKTWKMNATAWVDSNGASVTFTAEPRAHQDGQTAEMIVRLNGEEITTLPCTWDGTNFVCTAELEAADGYSYTCILVSPDGTREQIPLSSPDNPTYDTLVYMKSNLNAYCNLFVADWEVAEEKLNITSGYVQVQLPQITSDGTTLEFESAQLIFQLNGNTIETQTLELPEGEGKGSYETALTSVSFNMPEMQDDYQLDLELSVKLSSGDSITANGGSWFFNNGQLSMVVG